MRWNGCGTLKKDELESRGLGCSVDNLHYNGSGWHGSIMTLEGIRPVGRLKVMSLWWPVLSKLPSMNMSIIGLKEGLGLGSSSSQCFRSIYIYIYILKTLMPAFTRLILKTGGRYLCAKLPRPFCGFI